MTTDRNRKFVARARRSPEYWARVSMRDFTEELLERMERCGISRSRLAELAGVSPAYITKVLRGSENFTLETMSKLAMATGGRVRVHVADFSMETRWVDSHTSARLEPQPLSSHRR